MNNTRATKGREAAVKRNLLIGRGFNGWHALGIDETGCSFRSSGGSLDDYTYWTGKECHGYLSEAREGCLVYDAEHLDGRDGGEAFARFIFRGPMAEARIEHDYADGMYGETRSLRDCTGSDFVSPASYIKLLRERVPGIKLGVVRDGQIQWEGSAGHGEAANHVRREAA